MWVSPGPEDQRQDGSLMRNARHRRRRSSLRDIVLRRCAFQSETIKDEEVVKYRNNILAQKRLVIYFTGFIC